MKMVSLETDTENVDWESRRWLFCPLVLIYGRLPASSARTCVLLYTTNTKNQTSPHLLLLFYFPPSLPFSFNYVMLWRRRSLRLSSSSPPMAYIANCSYSTCHPLSDVLKLTPSTFAPTLSSSFLRLSLQSNNHTPPLHSPKFQLPRSAAKVLANKDVVAEMAVTRTEREKQSEKCGALRVGLICGGPSAERGISLNSARSVLDHIQVRSHK